MKRTYRAPSASRATFFMTCVVSFLCGVAHAQTPAWESMDGPLPSIPDEQLCAQLAEVFVADPDSDLTAEGRPAFEANCLEDAVELHQDCGTSSHRMAACVLEASSSSDVRACRAYCVELDPGPSMPVEGEPREVLYVCTRHLEMLEESFAGDVPADYDRWIAYQRCIAEYDANAIQCGDAFADVTWCQTAADDLASAEACLSACSP